MLVPPPARPRPRGCWDTTSKKVSFTLSLMRSDTIERSCSVVNRWNLASPATTYPTITTATTHRSHCRADKPPVNVTTSAIKATVIMCVRAAAMKTPTKLATTAAASSGDSQRCSCFCFQAPMSTGSVIAIAPAKA